MKNKRRERKIINHHIAEGTRESYPRVHDFGKPHRGLQIMGTRMGFPCPFRNVVLGSIIRVRKRVNITFLYLFTR